MHERASVDYDERTEAWLKHQEATYKAAVARLEPDVSQVGDAAKISMAISSKRIADSLDALTTLLTASGLGKLFEELKPIIERLSADE